jgi:hypothetical protein
MGRGATTSPAGRDVQRVLALLVATALALALWVLLVMVAVSHGKDARLGGGTGDWVVTGLVSVLAAAVLYLVMALLLRARAAWARRDTVQAVVGRHRL